MTLKENFYNAFISKPDLYPLNECERIAGEFAIGFAEWCDDNYFRMGNTYFWAESLDWDAEDKLTTKELLEIYKKEKGL